MGAPVGNQNGVKNRPIADAIRRALLANDGEAARAIAEHLMAAAKAGDMTAIREVLDRTEGKPKQQLEHTGAEGGPIEINSMSARDKARRVAFLLAQGAAEHGQSTH